MILNPEPDYDSMMPDDLAEARGYVYTGDVNPEHGGAFFDAAELETFTTDEYVSAIRVMDLDSGCGFTSAVLIERLTVLYDPEQAKHAASCCGFEVEDDTPMLHLADALLSYGYYDPDDYSRPRVVVVDDPEAPMEYDGWKADDRTDDLLQYIDENFLLGS